MDVHPRENEQKAQSIKRHEERVEQWRKTPGDLDDFIFHLEHPKQSSER